MRYTLLTSMLLAVWPTVAVADAVVTLCATDVQAGAGRNLQQAIAIGGLVTFRCGGTATILITSTHTIVRDTRIDGEDRITLDGQSVHRLGIFAGSDARISLSLARLKIMNGGNQKPRSFGRLAGGVVNGSLTLDVFRTSITRSAFPILLHAGSVRIRQSEFSGNWGTAVAAPAIEVLDRSRFSFNDIPIIGSGSAVIENSDFWSNKEPSKFLGGTLRITRSQFSNNTGNSSGGALFIACPATIEESKFHGNSASFGGAIYLNGEARTVSLRAVRFQENSATIFGGAIYAEFSGNSVDLVLRHTAFIANRARRGGAIELEASSGVSRFLSGAAVSFVRNEALVEGGAIHLTNAGMKMSRGVFVENISAKGAAISAVQSGSHTVELANCLIVKNKGGNGAAFAGNAVTFINTTIADNGDSAVTTPTGISPPGGAGSPPVFPIRFLNTIVSGGFFRACGPSISSSPYHNLGNNLQFPGSSCGSDIPSSYPALGPYYVPFFFSRALDGGNDAVCAAVPVSRKDIYNVRRPLGTRCAIGAVEGNVSHLINRMRERPASLSQ